MNVSLSGRPRALSLAAWLVGIVLGGSFLFAAASEPAGQTARPALYDVKADGEKQIAEALVQARQEHKRVLLQFGANWCGWCHKLHQLFASDAQIAGRLKRNYVVVMIDVDQGHNEAVVKRYGNPTRFGLPVIVVLDAQGKPLVTQDTGKLEAGDHHSPEKVLAFLNEWSGSKD